MKTTITTIALVLGLALGNVANAGDNIRDMVTAVANEHGIPPALAHSVVKAESTYRCSARSRDGAMGIMQVMPRTAKSIGVHGDLLDCQTGLKAGMKYLKLAIDRYGVTCAGISAYNMGIGGKARCTSYGRKIMRMMDQYNKG